MSNELPHSETKGFVRWRSPLLQLAAIAAVGVLVIGLGSTIATRRAGEAEAMAQVRALTDSVAQSVVEPRLTPELIAGDPVALAELDDVVTQHVLDGENVRVKLWSADGRIVYSDEQRLIGEVYELEAETLATLEAGEVVSEISDLDGPENRFEVAEGRLLEVYLPLMGPDGQTFMYESYYVMAQVDAANDRIRSEFAPILIGSLALITMLHLGLAWALNRRLRRNQAERERLLQRAVAAQDLERRRIASDLHDGAVQDLVATTYALSSAEDTVEAAEPEVRDAVHAASTGARASLQSLRSLLVDIYPPNLGAQGLATAIDDLAAPVRARGIRVTVAVDDVDDLDPARRELAYRVVREAAQNVIRHADADECAIRVSREADRLRVTVRDDGAGFDPSTPAEEGHLGLQLLRDAATAAGAQLYVESALGVGTTVRLEA